MQAVAYSPHLLGTAEVLKRVFFPPLKLLVTRRPQRILPRHLLPNFQCRNAYYLSTLNARRPQQPQDSGPPRDEAIGEPQIQVVDPTGGGPLQPLRRLRDALASIDRSLYYLVQVGEKIHPRYADLPGPQDGGSDSRPRVPVCKIVSKASFRQAKAEKSRPRKDFAATVKEVEINWSISQNDLNHRLKRLREFLEQGRRVEVALGKRKKKGWMRRKDVTDEQADGILKQIRLAVEEVDGAREWKEMEGQVKSTLVMHFEAKKERPEVKKKNEGENKVKKSSQAG
ncbi:MAG: hypothetical protein LQ348_002281 [Seirophora lacunosa]|nr:MAG: hypothetical protein LQ348_002281 [Seirophora lacunosa]